MNRVLVGFVLASLGIASVGVLARPVQAGTVVRFDLNYAVNDTSGPINYFDIELFDNAAPITVANFLQYVNNHLYDNTIIHRDVQDFVMQGGGFTPAVTGGTVTALNPITTYPPIQNEFSPTRSNVRGTVAMAKLGGDPNSATSQWFVNLGDNSANLDSQNGGFTVFGQILGNGMKLIDGVNSLQRRDLSQQFGSAFTEVPMFNNGTNFVTITKASVLAPVVPVPTGSLSGFVYVDTNHNGVMDAADYAIADAKVVLTKDGSSTPAATLASSADGSFHFNNLGAGTYSIQMQTPCSVPGQNNNTGHLVLDKNGNIVSLGTAGAVQQNAYTGITLGTDQQGLNFNFAESAYPVTLVSARMLLNTATGAAHTGGVASIGTNAQGASGLSFGNVLVGTTGKKNLTVTNTGSAGSELSGTFGAAGGLFSPTTSSDFATLESSQAASREYSFAPTARGTSTQDVAVGSDAGNLTVTLSGTGVAPMSSLAQTNAGYALVGGTAAASVTIKNVGDGNLSGLGDSSNLLGSLAAGSGAFAGAGGSISLGDGASQTFGYTFAPTTRGASSASLTASFTNGNPNGNNTAHTKSVTLSGTGVAPVSSVTQTNAGYALVGDSAAASVTIKNVGDGNLSGLGASSNLLGSLAAGSGAFAGAGGSISLGDSASQTFSYTFAPTTRGASSATIAADFTNGDPTGANAAHAKSFTLSGTGVAPVQAVDVGAADTGLVRIGTTGTASLTVRNIGDGNLSGKGAVSNLAGTAAAGSGVFTGAGGSLSLADSASQAFHYTYTPTAHANDSTSVALQFSNGSADGANLAETVNAQLSGQGVGPVYLSDAAPGATLEFGAVAQTSVRSLLLNVRNNSADPNGGNAALTDLTLLSAALSGNDSGLFSIVGFAPGTILHENDPLNLEIAYNGAGALGDITAMLTIGTDEGAALGGSGNSYSYAIHATLIPDAGSVQGTTNPVPEPGTLALLAVAGLVFGGAAWRRRTASCRVGRTK